MEDSSTVSPNIESPSAPFVPTAPTKETHGHILGYYQCECPCCLRMREQGFEIARMQVNGCFDMIEKKVRLIEEKLIKEVQHSQALMSELTDAHNEITYLENLLGATQDDLHQALQKVKYHTEENLFQDTVK